MTDEEEGSTQLSAGPLLSRKVSVARPAVAAARPTESGRDEHSRSASHPLGLTDLGSRRAPGSAIVVAPPLELKTAVDGGWHCTAWQRQVRDGIEVEDVVAL